MLAACLRPQRPRYNTLEPQTMVNKARSFQFHLKGHSSNGPFTITSPLLLFSFHFILPVFLTSSMKRDTCGRRRENLLPKELQNLHFQGSPLLTMINETEIPKLDVCGFPFACVIVHKLTGWLHRWVSSRLENSEKNR